LNDFFDLIILKSIPPPARPTSEAHRRRLVLFIDRNRYDHGGEDEWRYKHSLACVIEKTGGSERIREWLCHSTLLFVSCLFLLLATGYLLEAHGFASHPCERFAFFNKTTLFFEI